MTNFLTMLIDEFKITTPTFFARVVICPTGQQKFNVQSMNAQHICLRPISKAWLMDCIAALDSENKSEGIKQCKARVWCPITKEDFFIYYSDETDDSTV